MTQGSQSFANDMRLRKSKFQFSELIYLRHSPDVRSGIGPGGLRSGYEHYARYGRTEGRPRTFRRLRPGQSVTFGMDLPKKALSGFQLYIGIEQAAPADQFEVSLSDGGNIVFESRFPHGIVALDRSTDFLIGAIEGLGERVQVRLSIPGDAQNDIWLLTRLSTDASEIPFEGTAFYDDPSIAPPGAIGIVLSPVSQCNQSCPHCISKFSRKTFNKLSKESQDEIRAMAANGRISGISVDYSGDPFFTNARYFPIFDFIDELGVPYRIDTNGAYIDEDIMRRVARSRLFGINFSLDAATHRTHSRLRPGKIPFQDILRNVGQAVAILDEFGRDDVITAANFSIMRSNVHEALDFVDLCQKLKLKSVNFSHVHVYQGETADESLANAPELYNSIHADLLAKLASTNLVSTFPPPFVESVETYGRRRCSAPWESAAILSNGDVQACCVPGTKIGNLHQNTFDEIWSSKEAYAFREQAASLQGPICSGCAFYKHRGIARPTRRSQI